MQAILHIGASKCASSSLQAALCRRPVFASRDGARLYEYVCFDKAGVLIRGAHAETLARFGPLGYAASQEAEAILPDEAAARRLRASLAGLAAEGRTPVASFEGWFRSMESIARLDLLARLGLEARGVMVVRPPLEWLNSAWWQSGAWMGMSFVNWLAARRARARWADRIEEWRSLPGAESLSVLVLGAGLFGRFFGAIGAEAPEDIRINESLQGAALRFLQTHPQCDPIRMPAMDIVLERHMRLGGKPPWVIGERQARELMDYYRGSNERLLGLLDPAAREAVANDPRWWDAAAYAGRRSEPPDAAPLAAEELKRLVEGAFAAIHRLDARLREVEWAYSCATAATCAATATGTPIVMPRRAQTFQRALRKAVSINGLRRLVRG